MAYLNTDHVRINRGTDIFSVGLADQEAAKITDRVASRNYKTGSSSVFQRLAKSLLVRSIRETPSDLKADIAAFADRASKNSFSAEKRSEVFNFVQRDMQRAAELVHEKSKPCHVEDPFSVGVEAVSAYESEPGFA